MLIKLIKYLMLFTAGIILGYVLFSQKDEPIKSLELSSTAQVDSSSKNPIDYQKELPASSTVIPQIEAGESIEQASLKRLNQLIASQQEEITELQDALAIQITNNENMQNQQSEEKTPTTIETLSMQDFESKMKNQFLDRFKGYAIELEGKRLEDIKNQFDIDSDKAEWNASYENNIHSFIQDKDPNRLHYIDELTCNTNMCRLKVNSSDPNNWQSLFLSMTQQSWYKSITLSENSGDANIFIYFITRPQDTQ